MNSLILRTIAPLLVTIMLVFSVFICLRGHNEPGGGFIGGLIAASAMAILGMATGAEATRRALRLDPMAIAGFGVFIAGASGLVSLFTDKALMTSHWFYLELGETVVPLSTPMIFDIGVYLVVFGVITAVLFGLEDGGEAG